MPVLTNARHERFAQELAKGKYATDAHEIAGFKRHDGNASTLARRPEIIDRVEEISGKVAEKVTEKIAVDRAWVLDKLSTNALIAMGEQTVTKTVALKGSDKTVDFTVSDRDASAANRALELVGKEFGMFIDRKEVGKPGEFSHLNDDDLDKFIAERKALIGASVGGERTPPRQAGVRAKSNGVH